MGDTVSPPHPLGGHSPIPRPTLQRGAAAGRVDTQPPRFVCCACCVAVPHGVCSSRGGGGFHRGHVQPPAWAGCRAAQGLPRIEGGVSGRMVPIYRTQCGGGHHKSIDHSPNSHEDNSRSSCFIKYINAENELHISFPATLGLHVFMTVVPLTMTRSSARHPILKSTSHGEQATAGGGICHQPDPYHTTARARKWLATLFVCLTTRGLA